MDAIEKARMQAAQQEIAMAMALQVVVDNEGLRDDLDVQELDKGQKWQTEQVLRLGQQMKADLMAYGKLLMGLNDRGFGSDEMARVREQVRKDADVAAYWLDFGQEGRQ